MPRKDRTWESLLGSNESQQARLKADAKTERERDQLLEHWFAHPWNWLTGIDPTTTSEEFPKGQPIIRTTDEIDPTTPVKPFPAKEYLRRYVELIVSEEPEDRTLLVDKPRQMIISTATIQTINWICLHQQGRRCLLSKRIEKEAIEMLRDKLRVVHQRMPQWLQDRLPITYKPANRVIYGTMSYFMAVAQNVAEGAARGGSASIFFVDEAAYQDRFPAILAAAMPMCYKFIAVTTARVGPPGATAFKELLDGGRVVKGKIIKAEVRE